MPKIISNQKSGYNYFKIILNAPAIAKAAHPGQFVMVKAADSYDPLLRRPLGVHNVKGKQITLLYEIVGKGTRMLAQRKPGEELDLIGPLGNGFDYRPSPLASRFAILVAGGMGVAPLAFLAKRLTKRRPLVLIGAKTKTHILCEKEFKDFGCAVKITTDDGSKGFKGRATDLLKEVLHKNTRTQEHRDTIYACGPKPMLKEISRISQEYNLPAQISLEEHLACGIGACLGCVVNTKGGYKRVCKEGTVFDAKEIIWGE